MFTHDLPGANRASSGVNEQCRINAAYLQQIPRATISKRIRKTQCKTEIIKNGVIKTSRPTNTEQVKTIIEPTEQALHLKIIRFLTIRNVSIAGTYNVVQREIILARENRLNKTSICDVVVFKNVKSRLHKNNI